MQQEFSSELGALLPEDMVYEILTISGHGNWRGPKFIFRIPLDDPRRALLEKMPKVQSVKFIMDVYEEGVGTFDYFIRLNDRYEFTSAEFLGDRNKLIKRYLVVDNKPIYCEHIYCDYWKNEQM